MKKIGLFINIVMCLSLIAFLAFLVMDIYGLSIILSTKETAPPDIYQMYNDQIVQYILLILVSVILSALLIISLFFFNYRFDGIPMREKIANRIAESKEKKAQYKAEKAEEEKQQQIAELQAKIDELKK